jgi:hypothetical protein
MVVTSEGSTTPIIIKMILWTILVVVINLTCHCRNVQVHGVTVISKHPSRAICTLRLDQWGGGGDSMLVAQEEMEIITGIPLLVCRDFIILLGARL